MSDDGYYGRPILKPPTWTDLIPTYFFTGGLAGASGMLAFAARLRGERELERTLDVTVLAALGISTYCLIKDLGRPERFINMLRVFKITSPMSVGTYIITGFGGAFTLGVASDLIGAPRAFGTIFKGVAALLGPALSTYTGVLVSDTAAPAWYEGRQSMPFLFSAGAAASGAGAALAFGPNTGTLGQTVALLAAPSQLIALQALKREVGPKIKPAYETHKAKMYTRVATAMAVAGTVGSILGGKNSAVRRAAGLCLLAGACAERFAVMEAGRNSTRDPRYVIEQQRDRRPDLDTRALSA